MSELLNNLLLSLNNLEVHGKKNLDILLGCILAIEQAKNILTSEKEVEKNG